MTAQIAGGRLCRCRRRALLAVTAAVAALGVPVAAGADAGPVADPLVNVGPVTQLPVPRYVSIRADTARARRGPGLDQKIDWEFVRRGLPVEVTAEYGHWRRVRDSDGMGGWVHHSLLSGRRTGLVRGPEPVALRSGPKPGAAVRAMAEPGVVVRITGCEADWCEISAGAHEGWVVRGALWGVGPGEVIE